MTRRWIWLAVTGVLVALLGLGLGPARAAGPLQPRLTVSGLPPLQTSAGPTSSPALQPLKALEPGPTDFATPGGLTVAQATAPRQVTALADPTNYGDRYLTDVYGRPVQNDFIAVLHETVGSAQSALNLFRTRHPRDQDQVSYHALIGRDGTVYYIVPPEKRAFGAGNS
ncbi:MAG TPA: peptidoglycan recognition family protein, partial [Nodosilinea sp.]|nr:peptidoglycan recognition family protein [Nodosilinea sp.]